MAGFYISNLKKNIPIICEFDKDNIKDKIIVDDYFIKRNTINKFQNDKCFFQNDDFFCVIEGVLLNKKDLFSKYKQNDIMKLISCLYAKDKGMDFVSEFRGSFSGAIYDKKTKQWNVFTNHYGDQHIYYYIKDGIVIVGSQINFVIDALKENSLNYSFNVNAAIDMLTYGYLSDEKTYANEISRLLPGHILTFSFDSTKIHYSLRAYWKVRNDFYDLSNTTDDEIITELEKRFRNAVKHEYDKDLEYGYKSLAQISGGLDSRMNLWVASELGYKDILCSTFEQSGSQDELIANQITNVLGFNLIKWPLDTATHVMNIDKYVAVNHGSALYNGIGAEYQILSALDMNKFGLMHTGQLGDVVVGSILKSEKDLYNSSNIGLYNDSIDSRPSSMQNLFSNRESFLLTLRGFMGCISSHLYTQVFTNVSSPFMYVDFFEYCMSIPLKKRLNHKFYKKWIVKEHPEAAEFIWEKEGMKINASKFRHYIHRNKILFIKAIKNPGYVLLKLGLKKNIKNRNSQFSGMNPGDKWWKENEKLRNVFNYYFEKHIKEFDNFPELQKLLSKLYATTFINKTLVITVLATYKCYGFCDK